MSARGSLGLGFLGGACCVIPAALSAVGLGAASPLAFLKPYQPLLAGGAILMLGFAWRSRYSPKGGCTRCAEGAEPSHVPWALAAMSLLVLASAGYPYYGPYLRAQPEAVSTALAATPEESVVTHRFTVTGMTCGSCRAAVRAALGQVPGVMGVDVDLETGTTVVAVQPAADPGLEALLEAVREAGYKAAA